jgi:hypothetical protein
MKTVIYVTYDPFSSSVKINRFFGVFEIDFGRLKFHRRDELVFEDDIRMSNSIIF